MDRFYVYLLYDGGLYPFYVGMSKVTKKRPLGTRINEHKSDAIRYASGNSGWSRINIEKVSRLIKAIQSNLFSYKIASSNLTKEEAIGIEKALIAAYGMNGVGLLTNMTGGGECERCPSRIISPATREKIQQGSQEEISRRPYFPGKI